MKAVDDIADSFSWRFCEEQIHIRTGVKPSWPNSKAPQLFAGHRNPHNRTNQVCLLFLEIRSFLACDALQPGTTNWSLDDSYSNTRKLGTLQLLMFKLQDAISHLSEISCSPQSTQWPLISFRLLAWSFLLHRVTGVLSLTISPHEGQKRTGAQPMRPVIGV